MFATRGHTTEVCLLCVLIQALSQAQSAWTDEILASVRELQAQAQQLLEGQVAEAKQLLSFGEQDRDESWQKVLAAMQNLKQETEDIKSDMDSMVCIGAVATEKWFMCRNDFGSSRSAACHCSSHEVLLLKNPGCYIHHYQRTSMYKN